MKRLLSKNFSDLPQKNGWGQFIDIVSFKAERAGQKVIKVNPKGTSQHCSSCLSYVHKELSERWHSCPHCGLEADRDTNAAVLIKKVGLGVVLTIKALGGQPPGEARAVLRLSSQRREYVTSRKLSTNNYYGQA